MGVSIRGVVAGIGCLAVVLLGGCGNKTQQEETGEEGPASAKTAFRIGLIAKSSTNPVFQAARVGAEARAAELSKEYDVQVVIDWQTPPKEDAQKQADLITQLANGGANAIIISCSDAPTVSGAINDAVEKKGVPVMCFDSDAPGSKRFAYHGVDDFQTGKETMKRLAQAMGEEGVVAVLAGNQNAPNLQKRVQGVREEAQAHPKIQIKDVYYHVETPEDAANKVMQVMKANADITGWAMVGGWPLFTDALLTNWDPKVKLVAVDALPAQLPYVEQGIAQVLLAQKVYDWGYVSVDMTFRKVFLKEQVEEFNISPLVPVTKETLGSWARQLKKWGFDVPQKYLDMK